MPPSPLVRTNYFLQSESIQNAAWTKSNVTPTDATADLNAPNGQAVATKIVETAINAGHSWNPAAVPIVQRQGSTVCVSLYLRGGGTLANTRRLLVLANDGAGNNFCCFNPRTNLVDVIGAGGRARGEIFNAGGGWSRFAMYYTDPPAGQEANANGVFFELDNGADGAGISLAYLGAVDSGLYVWGHSLVTSGPFSGPPEYIATAGAQAAGNPRGLVR